jgi:hypothetical protein
VGAPRLRVEVPAVAEGLRGDCRPREGLLASVPVRLPTTARSGSPSLVRTAGLAVALALVGCGAGDLGALCERPEDCLERLTCVENLDGRGLCMLACEAGARLCDDGTVCLTTPTAGLMCWLGGTTPIGRPCETQLACEPGTVCHEGVCLQACDLSRDRPDLVCERAEVCVAVASGSVDGVCVGPEPATTAAAGGVLR